MVTHCSYIASCSKREQKMITARGIEHIASYESSLSLFLKQLIVIAKDQIFSAIKLNTKTLSTMHKVCKATPARGQLLLRLSFFSLFFMCQEIDDAIMKNCMMTCTKCLKIQNSKGLISQLKTTVMIAPFQCFMSPKMTVLHHKYNRHLYPQPRPHLSKPSHQRPSEKLSSGRHQKFRANRSKGLTAEKKPDFILILDLDCVQFVLCSIRCFYIIMARTSVVICIITIVIEIEFIEDI